MTSTETTPPQQRPVQIVRPGGFDWGDAGIGAAGMTGLALLAVGATLALRTRRPMERKRQPRGDVR